jgi:GT2 family glycosyltransferase
VEESPYDWVCFVDDDARVHTDFLKRMWYVRDHFAFDGYGGMFYPWYKKPKPRWLSAEFGKKNKTLESTGAMKPGQTVAGGICAFNKQKLMAAGGFPENVGMRGQTVGYGEEDVLQQRMWQQGCVIGFDPEWKMDHLVADYKYSPWWHLRRSFAKGRDYQAASGGVPFAKKILLTTKAVVLIPCLFVRNLKYFISRKTYYPENYLLDSLRMPFRILGRVIAR